MKHLNTSDKSSLLSTFISACSYKLKSELQNEKYRPM